MEKPPTQEKVYTVNEAQPEDAAGIARVRKETWLATYPNVELGVNVEDILSKDLESEQEILNWKKAIENPASARKAFVAKDDETVIGYSQGKKGESHNECWGLYVLPAYHGKGIGRELMQKVIDWLGDEKPLELNVATISTSAIELYKSFGFEEVDEPASSPQFASGAILPSIKIIRPAKDQNKHDWVKYLEQTKEYPPSPLLVKAISDHDARNSALDLGAGQLKDTRFLLTQDFLHIDVVDAEPAVESLVEDLKDERVKVIITTFDAFDYKDDAYDLVNAQYAIPFASPEVFEKVMSGIKRSLKQNGIFVGQLFGKRDEWNTPGKEMTFHSEEEARALFSDMELLTFEEVERDSRTSSGAPKHWHLYNIVAKKI